jgi:hypothetical protein
MRAGAGRVERLMECVRNWSGGKITQTTAWDPMLFYEAVGERKKRLGEKREKNGSGILAFASSTTNPVCERRVDLLVCSLPLHRHSYIGFILAFASSFHNKQPFFTYKYTYIREMLFFSY